MSGLELSAAVVGLVAGSIEFIKITKEIINAVKGQIPKQIRNVVDQLSGIQSLLEQAQRSRPAADLVWQSVKEDLERCYAECASLKDLFEKVMPKTGTSRLERGWLAGKAIVGRTGAQADKHLIAIRKTIVTLQTHYIIDTSTLLQELHGSLEGLSLASNNHGAASTTALQGVQSTLAAMQATSSAQGTKNVTMIKDLQAKLQEIQISTSEYSRLQRVQLDATEDKRIKAWLAPPDSESIHAEARARHEESTGNWLLSSPQYQAWKAAQDDIVWLYGKPGCGKTVLCSSVVEDLQELCKESPEVQLATFYFSDSDVRKKSYTEMLTSLIVQLRHNQCTAARLQQEWNQGRSGRPSQRLLEEILLLTVQQYERVVLVLDALDELPDERNARVPVLRWLKSMLRTERNVQVFVTSRDLPDLRTVMSELDVSQIAVSTTIANDDISRYVKAEVARHSKLQALDSGMKAKILDTFREKSDGMFRWASCQMEELKRVQIPRPKYIEQIIRAFPPGLDAMYERKLDQIDEMYREETCKVLRWLAFETEPLSLAELSEAVLINIDKNPALISGIEARSTAYWSCLLISSSS